MELFSDPWNPDSLLECLGDVFLVIEVPGELVGYSISRIGGPEAELLSIGVTKKWRKMGVGGRLLEESIARLRENGAEDLFLEVRESNEVAILFYARNGFREVGKRIGYYRFPPENALVLIRKILPV